MVRTRPPRAGPVPEDSSSSVDSSTDLIPRSISYVTWTQLPSPRADPLDATSRKWMTDLQPAVKPFCIPPSVGNDFFRDSLVAPMKLSPQLSVFKRVEDLNALIQRWSYITHTFFAAWGEFTPTLEDVHVLLKWPLFGDFDIMTSSIDSHIIDRAKKLKAATIESAKYSREFLARLQAEPLEAISNPKTPSRRVRDFGNVLPLDKRKVAWSL
ncbi:Aminotransferase-like, plant mobile domain [Sesbania bispinosa]|nr:Aminotransferase-like, plant mobile domain [Sesbania bispinosa]